MTIVKDCGSNSLRIMLILYAFASSGCFFDNIAVLFQFTEYLSQRLLAPYLTSTSFFLTDLGFHFQN